MKNSELQQRIENAERELAKAKALLAQQETKSRVVDSVTDIPNRRWFISGNGRVFSSWSHNINQISTKQRAEAILALTQLIEIHAAIEQKIGASESLCSIKSINRNIILHFWFESKELKDEFETKHKDLIETVQKGL